MAHDWYRKRSWTPADEEDFHKRLARARAWSRPQYLRLQAWTLMELGERYYQPALTLLDMHLDRFPDDFDHGQALSTKGDCLNRMGNIQEAILFYEQAIECERAHPGRGASTWRSFAWLVASERLSDRYKCALALLDEFGASPSLRTLGFQCLAAKALILGDCGRDEPAAEAARDALAAAEQSASFEARYPTLGVKSDGRHGVSKQLLEIAQRGREPEHNALSPQRRRELWIASLRAR